MSIFLSFPSQKGKKTSKECLSEQQISKPEILLPTTRSSIVMFEFELILEKLLCCEYVGLLGNGKR
jgi:hypothetical protein